MIRSLWTAATGMKAQQLNIDTISNNLANVNTTGYKTQRTEFKDLMYTELKRSNLEDDEGAPVNIQVGHGVMTSAISRDMTQGSVQSTDNPLDVAIDGEGYFEVVLPNGESRYTRDGSFKLSVDGNTSSLVTSEGYYILDNNNNRITMNSGLTDLSIDTMGNIIAKNANGENVDVGTLKLVNFTNPKGLLNDGRNLYEESVASGNATVLNNFNMDSEVLQRYLETSNVKVVDEMVKMITAQRAYEISSKSIQTSDEMMQQANNLKR
ncbi:flagellar basal-body rod protein FlgG [Clostridium sp. D2Q-11]|uniref:Flagellar basal-body rod protein FlgG n=1 Tax=Anaeromonas frigoriresistens TaxID=2683708 RepID=A0A942V1K0_9FIRM|nr:flagellar basal-body rod protein FlgG [Anaeromonas frigoriresistens]MBS4538307.1 flagellar basal-body rod protein FlgG [Anaeromonas frigoriresistens]